MGKDPKEEGPFRRLLKSIPGMKPRASENGEDQGNSYEFEATIGQKGSSLGITFDSVSKVLARLRKGMKARVIMEREPGTSIFSARIYFVEPQKEEKENVS